MEQPLQKFWALPKEKVFQLLKTREGGLSEREAKDLCAKEGENVIRPAAKFSSLSLFISQFSSPLILILIGAAILAFALYDKVDALIILVIVFFSGLLGFFQERGAFSALHKLLQSIKVKTKVLRDSKEKLIQKKEVVRGDILILNAGNVIVADALIIESRDLFVDESALTGEPFGVEKEAGVISEDLPLAKRKNVLYAGCHIISGTAKAVVFMTGRETEFGKIAEGMRGKKEKTEFEREIRAFGAFLMEVTFVLVFLLFALNMAFHHPVLESFLFSLALAVGLTPQLLPAIVTTNLAKGARRMAKLNVIVKRLASIENFGNMDVLCVDKTGTVTEGKPKIHSFVTPTGEKADGKMPLYTFLNASFQSGYMNPIDKAILQNGKSDITGYKKLDEIPYDFSRKRLSILAVKDHEAPFLICKGATQTLLPICSKVENASVIESLDESKKEKIEQQSQKLQREGFRLLAVAYKSLPEKKEIKASDEFDLILLGFLVLEDPLKKGIQDTVKELRHLGISLLILTGDNVHMVSSIANELEIDKNSVLKGSVLHHMSDIQLMSALNHVKIFAELEPLHKERIIRLLKKQKHVVGFMGDGINDALAIKSADVGISVNTAVDIAKEEADIVMLRKDLSVLARGVEEGRKIFANTLKYIFMATSANFGNMFSVAGASLFLTFLPLLPKQILLTNLLTDLPEITISTDRVDKEMVDHPTKMNIGFIAKFMMVFGLISSLFDFATFFILLYMNTSVPQFRTGWFMESVLSASLIVLVIRTRNPFYRSLPSKALLFATLGTCALTLIIPYTYLGTLMGFKPIPPIFYGALALILTCYILTAEIAKHFFYKWMHSNNKVMKRRSHFRGQFAK